jgi:hypothetical protein
VAASAAARVQVVREQLGLVNAGHFLNRFVLDFDALGHQHVAAITRLNLDSSYSLRLPFAL